MKPIAWYDPSNGMVSTDQDCPLFTPLGQVWGLYPKEEAKDEPVAEVTSETGADITMSWWHEPALPVGTKLYTTPSQRTWVGLTDEHKEGLICMTDPNPEPHHLRELIDVVEYELRKRNDSH